MSLDLSLYGEADTGAEHKERVYVFAENITHNVARMWTKADVFGALYESEGMLASSVIPTLRAGLDMMERDPQTFRALNPENGWGQFDGEHGAFEFLRAFLKACEEHPKAIIGVSA